jgi:hypothetical protein
MNETPSPEQFAAALQRARISQLQRDMMKAHYQAPEHTLTATQMANALGYPHYSVSNGNYGRLGRLLGKALDWVPPTDSENHGVNRTVLTRCPFPTLSLLGYAGLWAAP